MEAPRELKTGYRYVRFGNPARDALESRLAHLTGFASIVSHDLRSPLNVIDGHLLLLREEQYSKHLDVMGDAHDRMMTLVEDLLSLARHGDDVGEMTPV